MAYHPTFAFFAAVPTTRALADSMIAALGDRLTEFGVDLPADYDSSRVTDGERARRLLEEGAVDVDSFWLASELHSISFWIVRKEYLAIDFGDFDSERYDEGLTEEIRAEKRRLAVDLHAALLRCGASLSYTESGDEKSDTAEPSIDRAARIGAGLATGNIAEAAHQLRRANPWLLALGPHAEVIAELHAAWLAETFDLVANTPANGQRVYESLREHPLFLLPARRGATNGPGCSSFRR